MSRDALVRYAWQEAFDGFLVVDAVGALSPEDLEAMSEAASLAGADEIRVSAEVADRLGTHVRVLRQAATSLKGIPEAVEVATVVWH